MNQIQKSSKCISLFSHIKLKTICLTSKPKYFSTSITTDSPQTKPFSNPFYNLLPETQNPNKLVNLVCTSLKQKPNEITNLALQEHNTLLLSHLGSSEISRILLRCQADSSTALTFFNYVKSDLGQTPSAENHCIAVHILVYGKKFKDAMNILSELIENFQTLDVFKSLIMYTDECNYDPVVFDILLKAYLKKGMVKEGYRTFKKMVKLGFSPSVFTINCLLNSLSKSNNREKCWEIYTEMGRIQVHPNSCTFNILTHIICKECDVEKVNEFLEKMEEEGFNPDIVTYNMLIDSYCKKGRLKDAVHLYNIMYIRRVYPDLFTHTSLINGFCKGGNVKEAHKLFHGMVNKGLKPDLMLYNTLICGYSKEKMMREARSLLHEMLRSDIFPDDFTCYMLIEGYYRQNRLISAVNLVVELRKFKIKIPREIYDNLISVLCKENKPFAAMGLMERINEPGNLKIYEDLINSLCNCNYVTEALQLKDEMLIKNLKLGLGIYKGVISCLCRLGRVKEGELLMKEMKENKIVPDSDICRVLVNGYCEKRDFKGAECVLCVFSEEFGIFDVRSYNEVFECVCKEGDIGKAMELQKRMMKVGFVPNKMTSKYIIDGMKKAMGV